MTVRLKLQTHGGCKCTLAPSSAALVAAPSRRARAHKRTEGCIGPPAGTIARAGSPGRRESGNHNNLGHGGGRCRTVTVLTWVRRNEIDVSVSYHVPRVGRE